MSRARALQVLLGFVGLIFIATAYPLVMFIREDPALAMMFSLYVTLGAFLLLAVRNPPESRALIGFTAWSSLVHAVVMGLQALRHMVGRVELIGVAFLVAIGVGLLALAPEKCSEPGK